MTKQFQVGCLPGFHPAVDAFHLRKEVGRPFTQILGQGHFPLLEPFAWNIGKNKRFLS